MLVRFFSERTGGVKFFQELEIGQAEPGANLGLLEIMHACLSLGFEGFIALQQRRRRRRLARAYAAISMKRFRRVQPDDRRSVAPLAWPDDRIIANRFRVPIWSIAAVAAVILLGIYLVLRNMLSNEAEPSRSKWPSAPRH